MLNFNISKVVYCPLCFHSSFENFGVYKTIDLKLIIFFIPVSSLLGNE